MIQLSRDSTAIFSATVTNIFAHGGATNSIFIFQQCNCLFEGGVLAQLPPAPPLLLFLSFFFRLL